MKKLRLCLLAVLFSAAAFTTRAQVSISTTASSPDSSAMLDVTSSDKGVLVPRMTMAQRNAIVKPATGLLIYQTDNTPGFYFNSGTKTAPVWIVVSSGWSIKGNGDTNPVTDFVGTTDDNPLILGTNNVPTIRISAKGQIEPLRIPGSVYLGEKAGAYDDLFNSNYNVFLGFQSGMNNMYGQNNTSAGKAALYSNLYGSFNTATGMNALYTSQGSENTATGSNALYLNQDGSFNTAAGRGALYNNTSGNSNTAVGYYANVNPGNLSNATALGSGAVATSSNQVRLGNDNVTTLFCKGAYASTTSSLPNVSVDANGQIMRSTSNYVHPQYHAISSVSDHFANNWKIFYSNGSGAVSELALGASEQVLKSNGEFSEPSWITLPSEKDSVIGNEVVAATSSGGLIRSGAGSSTDPYTLGMVWGGDGSATTSSRSDHTHANDHSRLHNMTSLSDHSATGWRLFYSDGSGIVSEMPFGASGYFLKSNGNAAVPSWSPEQDGFIGNEVSNAYDGSLIRMGTGVSGNPYTLKIFYEGTGSAVSAARSDHNHNSAFWRVVGNSGTVPGTNFIGTTDNVDLVFKVNNLESGRISSSGDNTSFGYRALSANTTGSNNTAVGSLTLYINTSGQGNSANGNGALYQNVSGNFNTAMGYFALGNNYSGTENCALGDMAGYNNSTGSFNTCLGYNSGPNSGGYTNTTSVGNGATTTASNKVVVGNSSVTSIGGYANWTNFSDGRFKKNIRESVPGLSFITLLRPVVYTMDIASLNADLDKNTPKTMLKRNSPLVMSAEEQAAVESKEKIVYTGFIAQEVEEAARQIGYDFSGVDAPKNDKDYYGLRYGDFVVPLVKAVQEQQAIIENQQKQMNDLKSQNADLLRRIEMLERK